MTNNFKIHKRLAPLFLLLFALLISACKKDLFLKGDLTNAQRIENAKTWYEAEQKNKKINLISSKHNKTSLIFTPKWENAVVENIDGNTVISMIVSTNLKEATGKNTNFNLVISLDAKNRYEAKTVAINNYGDEESKLSNEEIYRTAFTPTNLTNERKLFADIKVFNINFSEDKHVVYTIDKMRLIETQKNAPKFDLNNITKKNIEDKTSAVVIITVCTDWWLITEEYDSGNNLIWMETTYLGRSCEDFQREIDFIAPENPGGGGTPSDTTRIDFGQPIDGPVTINDIPEEDADNIKYMNRYYTWDFHRAMTNSVTMVAYSKGRLKKLPGTQQPWRFSNFKFLSAYPVGNAIGEDLQVIIIDSEVMWSDFDAKLHLYYKLHSTFQGLGTIATTYSREFSKDKEFAINNSIFN